MTASRTTLDATFSPGNQHLLALNDLRRATVRRDIELFYPWWRRCTVNVLLVTDGNLNFGEGDFGLSTLIRTLLDEAPLRVRFRLTLAHLRSSVSPGDMLGGETRIAARLTDFRFDEPSHFQSDQFDEVWMFGIETNLHAGSAATPAYATRRANPGRYPAGSLGTDELKTLSAHMHRGGGVFATGDHGSLGRALCGSITRVRSMRWWESHPSTSTATDEVSMTGPRRNDTNRRGHDAGWQFSDQSDDVPQVIDLKLYSTPINLLSSARYPHPLLCGRTGRIDVLPDHPHEGECRDPASLTETFAPDGSPEYPFATGSTTQRVAPEVIAWANVPSGNSGSFGPTFKQATIAHSFPVISAYDGHRAGVGRVVCDSTWHHFVNVNLIGVLEGGIFDEFDTHVGEHGSKHDGFLSSVAGGAVLDRIRNYFTNIGVWTAPPARHTCFHRGHWWDLVFSDRIMEAALTDPQIPLERIPADTLWSIGVHARDVFARRASQCQSRQWLIDWLIPVMPELRPWIDPWDPAFDPVKGPRPLPMLDPMPLADVALGAALVALRQAMPYPPEKLTEEHDKLAGEVIGKAVRLGLKSALADYQTQTKTLAKALRVV